MKSKYSPLTMLLVIIALVVIVVFYKTQQKINRLESDVKMYEAITEKMALNLEIIRFFNKNEYHPNVIANPPSVEDFKIANAASGAVRYYYFQTSPWLTDTLIANGYASISEGETLKVLGLKTGEEAATCPANSGGVALCTFHNSFNEKFYEEHKIPTELRNITITR